jgi:uracil-DNA glycosylase family 4
VRPRPRVYVTNAVKHFKFEPRGKRRMHKRLNASEIKICRRWLFEEIQAIGPRLIVALGATAAQGLAGRAIPVQSNRGTVLDVANGLRLSSGIGLALAETTYQQRAPPGCRTAGAGGGLRLP